MASFPIADDHVLNRPFLLELAAERDPVRLLEIGCRAAQDLCGSKYAAVGILDDSGERLEQYVTRGMDDMTLIQLALPAPRGGVLGRCLAERAPQRLAGLAGDARRVGLPPSHPPLHSFLAVPVASRQRLHGWLYLADRRQAQEALRKTLRAQPEGHRRRRRNRRAGRLPAQASLRRNAGVLFQQAAAGG